MSILDLIYILVCYIYFLIKMDKKSIIESIVHLGNLALILPLVVGASHDR